MRIAIKLKLKPSDNQIGTKSRAKAEPKSTGSFRCETRSETNSTENDAAVEPRHVLKMNRWLMQSVGIHEFAMGNLNPNAQKLVVFAQRSLRSL